MPSIDVKQAVATAKATISQLFSGEAFGEPSLEEIDLVDEGSRKCWAVTVGMHRMPPSPTPGTISAIFTNPAQAEPTKYKTVFIDADTGEFVKMDMRLV